MKLIRPTCSIEKMQNIEVLTLNMWLWNTYVLIRMKGKNYKYENR